MKFTCSTTINLPREKVVELWENPDNLKHWQDGFVSMTHISGTPGQVGAKSLMLYNGKQGEMELTETIKVNKLPDEFSGFYEHKHMDNYMTNTFTSPTENSTTWTTEVEYTRFGGFMITLMAKLFPGMFKKQVQKWLDQFKAFAEKQA